jgi:hypothetical protein
MVDDSAPGPTDFGAELCAAFQQDLPITGVAVSAFPGMVPETPICASDAISARIDEMQFELGEGPRWTAMRTRMPVALPNVKSDGHPQWPVFAKALLTLDVSALFEFPLVLGSMDIGVVELYSTASGPLSPADHAKALQLADAAAWKLLRHLLTAAPLDATAPYRDDGPRLSRREIHQATGMVLAQAGVSATDALLLLRAHAFAQGRPVHEVARDVVGRTLDFTPTGGGGGDGSVQ